MAGAKVRVRRMREPLPRIFLRVASKPLGPSPLLSSVTSDTRVTSRVYHVLSHAASVPDNSGVLALLSLPTDHHSEFIPRCADRSHSVEPRAVFIPISVSQPSE